MSEIIPTDIGILPSAASPLPLPVTVSQEPGRKGLDLAVIKKGAKDFLDFMDGSKEVFYAYLYHRTGSQKLAQTLLSEIFIDTLTRAMSLWWFGTLSLKLLLDRADQVIGHESAAEADLDAVYLPSLVWLTEN